MWAYLDQFAMVLHFSVHHYVQGPNPSDWEFVDAGKQGSAMVAASAAGRKHHFVAVVRFCCSLFVLLSMSKDRFMFQT